MKIIQHFIDNLQTRRKSYNDIWEKCGFSRCVMAKRVGGSDAADVTAAGIPCVDNMGAWGSKIHTQNEFAYLSSLGEATKRIASALMYL